MKKSLIAIAALAAAGAASAQSSVTLYGVIDTYYGYSKTNASVYDAAGYKLADISSSALHGNSGGLWGSRIGFKGQEDLGNGLSAVFDLQMGLNTYTGHQASYTTFDGVTGTGFNRRSVVGLKGSFGEVLYGRDTLPMYGFAANYTADGWSSFDTTLDAPFVARSSGLFYNGNFYGLEVNAAFGRTLGSTTVNDYSVVGTTTYTNANSSGNVWGLGLGYTIGGFSVKGAVQQAKQSTNTTTIVTTSAGSTGTWTPASTQQTDFGIGLSYDFGPAKLYAAYLQSKNTVDYTNNYSKWEQYNIGVTAPLGPVNLVAEYGRNRINAQGDVAMISQYGITSLGSSTRVSGSGNNFTVGADYNFSKRTMMYARISRNAAINAKIYDVPTGVYGGSWDTNTMNYAIGIKHTF